MRVLALTATLAATLCVVDGAHAQLSQASRSPCPNSSTIDSWCPAQLSKEGWTLKYRTQSPKEMADASWRYEVWTREKLAVVCVMEAGRRHIRMNGCRELSEVHQ
jgi:hypothetical protein